MKVLFKRLTALGLAGLLALGLAVPALAAGETAPQEAQTAAVYAAQYSGAQSVQYALWEEGKITLSGSTGSYSRTENRALTDDILYGIGSVSKIYTTAAVMRLAEAGKLRLDAPVTAYLPAFHMADARYRQITVRMLLNHSSGLMGSSTNGAFLFDDPDRSATETLLERLSTQRLKADPGAYSVYCNDGFTLAELVVEAVSGESFPEYIHSTILTPLGLKNTLTPQDSFDGSRLAKTYADAQDTRALPADTLGVVGTGGIYASASDLAAFGGALTGTELLQKTSSDAMAAAEYQKGLWPADDLDSFAYGLGWDNVRMYPFCQSGIQALVKGGDTYQYHAGLVVLPQYRLAAAVLFSGGSSTYAELAATRMLISALRARGVTVDETVPALPAAEKAPMPAKLTADSGYYAGSQQLRVEITADGALKLYSLNYASLPPQEFAYYADGTFRDASGTIALRVIRETNGETYLWQKAVTPVPGLGAIPTSNYLGEKMPENTVSPEAEDSWRQALTGSYLPVNEKYTSQLYWMLSVVTSMGLNSVSEQIPGYVGSCKITDTTHAVYVPQVPGLYGRDGADCTLFEKDGIRWIDSGGTRSMEQSGAKALFTGGGWSYSTIQPDGYARWYQVGAAAGQTMTAVLPEKGGFYVYDAKGILTASSVLWGDRSAVLPEGGLVVFAGDAGQRFHLRFTQG